MEKYISMLLTIVIIVFSLLSILLNFNLRKFVMSLSKYKNQNFWKVTGRFLKYIFSIDPLYQYLSSSKLKRFSVIGVIIFMCILLLSSFYTTASIRYDSVSLVRFLIISFIISWIIIGLAASLIYKLLYFMLTSVQQLKVHKSLNTVDPFFLFTVPVMFMFMFFTSDISDKQPWLVYVMLVPIYICHFNILKSMLLTAFNSDLLVIDKYKSDIYITNLK
ncbi:hypothetical protein [Paenibacillus cucumis (ex Kampfer et al. 2016)]|uniref:Uncharacterized protein n=1 Tax=Paenibacillus cucumis (ex Kampfer et al. 2016) TaxID=1776858 RepID=A0ABS7KKM7_9BACL|nr:hypothetical protein [Paenibacillus cucumis (ex Kampfer et al. 2016)]MBY0204674.1 hypothetical protein [Paenibacillus cucumis (ex Kampfer et al. 2016)]